MPADAMVRTPEGKIPVAEVFTDNGVVYLRFKKPKNQKYEVLTLDHFLWIVYETIQREYWRESQC